jgi:hypothetical protein
MNCPYYCCGAPLNLGVNRSEPPRAERVARPGDWAHTKVSTRTKGIQRMRATKAFASACCVALFGIAASSSSAAVDAETQVLAKDLNAARASGKVAAVIWTVRTEHCTLQVVFPKTGRFSLPMRERPRVQVWLLKADGSLIAPTQRAEPDTTSHENVSRHPYADEILFAFPLSADKEAVAAAIRVDDAFYIEPLSSLSHEHG